LDIPLSPDNPGENLSASFQNDLGENGSDRTLEMLAILDADQSQLEVV